MNWKLKNVIQETNHKFLNFYTLIYEVEKDGKVSEYSYFMASRKTKDQLISVTKNYQNPDGVIIPCYLINPKNNKLSLVITKQFRPALNNYVHSFPAGLIDGMEDPLIAAKREALEEVGAIIDQVELLAPASPTSSGLSDEMNCIVLAHVSHFEKTDLEEFEDINYQLIAFEDLEKYASEHFFALQIRVIIKYLLERFKGQY